MEKLTLALEKASIPTSTLVRAFSVGKRPVYRLTVSGQEAVPIWRQLRKITAKTGHWPVLLGTDEDLEILDETLEDFEELTPGQILGRARKIKVTALFARWHKIVVENAQETLKQFRETDDAEDVVAHYEQILADESAYRGVPRGDWPEWEGGTDDFSIPYDVVTKKPFPHVHIGLVPTLNGYEIPAFLNFGGWNECPHPHQHVAVMSYWHERYGAEVVGIDHDTVEMLVARPPRSRARALKLAWEQYLYCPDIVEQGMETLEALAAGLVRSRTWFFWWD